MKEKTEEETLKISQKRKEKREGMRREAIRGVMAEEEKGLRVGETKMMAASNVANLATLLLSVTQETQGPSHRRMPLTTRKRLSIILRGLCLLRRMTSRLMTPLLMKPTTHPSVEWPTLTPQNLIKRYLLLTILIRLNACSLNLTENSLFFNSMHTDLLKKLAFYERQTNLLTEEKDKFYKEYTSSFEIFKKERNTLNEKITLLEKSLKDKTSKIRNILHEKSNVVSLTNYSQNDRVFTSRSS